LGGVAKDLVLPVPKRQRVGEADVITLASDSIEFELNHDQKRWVFNDFDAVFDYIVNITGTQQASYDMFGHSAGAQVLHRYALLSANNKVNRIFAANAGFYTLPTQSIPFPFGLKGLEFNEQRICQALSKKLIILVGEKDNWSGAGGTFLITPETQQQGEGRLQRGKFFVRNSKQLAASLGCTYQWQLRTVANVGHNGYWISQAAAKLL